MDAAAEQLQTLLELEARHEELLDRLADLDKRVVEVLAQYQTSHPPESVPRLYGEDPFAGQVGVFRPSNADGPDDA
jgi:hypothetical protein